EGKQTLLGHPEIDSIDPIRTSRHVPYCDAIWAIADVARLIKQAAFRVHALKKPLGGPYRGFLSSWLKGTREHQSLTNDSPRVTEGHCRLQGIIVVCKASRSKQLKLQLPNGCPMCQVGFSRRNLKHPIH